MDQSKPSEAPRPAVQLHIIRVEQDERRAEAVMRPAPPRRLAFGMTLEIAIRISDLPRHGE